jgi:outer membrane lipoprotein-sorting protein
MNSTIKNLNEMKKQILIIPVLLIISVFTLQGQNLQEVLQKHFEAVGQENLLKKESAELKATIKQMGMEIPMTMKIKRPDKFRSEVEMQGMKMLQVYNGEEGWMIAPWISSEPQKLAGAELKQAMDQANLDGELYNYAEKGSTATLVGKVNVEGSPMFNIKFTDKDGDVKNYFIDAQEYLIRKIKAKLNAQGQEMEVEQNIKDYRKVDGVMMPGVIESITPMGTAQIVITEVKFGENYDDSLFEKP